MRRLTTLGSALWQWGIPSVVLIAGLAVALADSTGTRLAFEIGVALALALPLVYRYRAPILVFGMVVAATIVHASLSSASQIAIPLAVLFASEAVGRHADEPLSWVAPLTLITVIVGLVVLGDDQVEDLVFGGTVMVGVWFLGRSFRLRAEVAARERERAAVLVRLAQEREAVATEVERIRIARELHDIVGHATSLVTIRLQTLRRKLKPGDPVGEEIKSIEGDARQALSEMRRLVSIMRLEDAEVSLEPQPGLAQLPGLVASMQKAGFHVETRVTGLPETLNPGVDLAAYRLIQEALTNTMRHSGGSQVEISVSVDRGELLIEIADDGASSHPSRQPGGGLIGMRERTALYGGTMSAGPVPEGGFCVRAVLHLAEGQS